VLVPGDADDHPFVDRLQALGVPLLVCGSATKLLTEYRKLRALIARLEPRIVHSHGYRADLIGAQRRERFTFLESAPCTGLSVGPSASGV